MLDMIKESKIFLLNSRITFICVNPLKTGTFMSCSLDNSLRCWDLNSGLPLKKIVLNHPIIACQLL